jgi:predicted enzyme related to lactoylglutathione lyase
MGRVVHFEITADDVARAQKFYEIFGWKIADSGMPGAEYLLARTGEDDMGIDGAIMPRSYKPQPVIPWIAVDDLDAMVEKVKKTGGQVAGEKRTVPGIGDTIYITDTEDNTVGLIQALPPSTE